MSENISFKMGLNLLRHSIWVRFFVEYCIYLLIKTVRMSYNQHKLYQITKK